MIIEGKLKGMIINNLRRVFSFSDMKREAKKRVEVCGFGIYLCEGCDNIIVTKKAAQKNIDKLFEMWYHESETKPQIFFDNRVEVDHINGCVDSGDPAWPDSVIRRMFCGSKFLQVLCVPCHYIKTRMLS